MPFSSSATRSFPTEHLDFESGNLAGWSCKRLFGAHSAVVQSDVVRVGNYACRFELRPGDYISQGHRAELRDHYNVRWDERVWYGFSTFLSAEHRPSDGAGLVLAQWHDQAKLGDPSGKPPIAIRYRDGRLSVTGAYGKFASPAPDQRYEFLSLPDFPLGRWHDFVFEVFWSRHGTSEIRAWLNGETVIDWSGPLAYENEVEGPYFKLGVYCSPPDVVPVVAYHDNYSRGHSYAEVDPSVLHSNASVQGAIAGAEGRDLVPPPSQTGEGDHAKHGGGGNHRRRGRHSPPPPRSAVPLPRKAGEEPAAATAPPSRPRCVLTILPAEGGDPDRVIASLQAAKFFGLGDLTEVALLPAPDAADPQAALSQGARAAIEAGYDWLLAVSAAEILAPDIFVKTAPALRLHDAVWGGAGLGETGKLEQISRLAAQDLVSFFHAALRWWIGPAHFVRPEAALSALAAVRSPAWRADYMLALWRNVSAYKTAQCLTLFDGALPQPAEEDRQRLVEALERDPVFMPVSYGRWTVQLPYTGLNPVIEREQARGQFFEHEELTFLAKRCPRGLTIVDAGANTGNHTLFFAMIMEAETVIPIEPQPRAASAIRAAVEENRLENVDLSHLGYALGSTNGQLDAVLSAGGGLGATHYVPHLGGAVALRPLDALVPDRVDLIKIDVEGMELDVLSGAAGIIARCRPLLFVEVLDESIVAFLRWIDANHYRIEKLFPDKSHCNYFVVPAER